MAKIVPDVWSLPQPLRQKLGARAGRQRLLLHEGHAVLVLHHVPRPNEHGRRPAVFWRLPDGSWRANPGADELETLRAHLEGYATAIEEIDERLEHAKRASEFFAVLRAARPLHRAARNLNAVMSALRDAFPEDTEVNALRDRAYDLERQAELEVGDAENGMEFMVAQRAEEQAAASSRIAAETHRLNLLAAICLPVTALGAILGMNLENGLETLPEPVTFWLVVAAAFGFGFLLRSRVQKA